MSKYSTKSSKGGVPKTPKDNAMGSTIKQYLAQGMSPKNIDQEAQRAGKADKKKGTDRKREETSDQSRDDLTTES